MSTTYMGSTHKDENHMTCAHARTFAPIFVDPVAATVHHALLALFLYVGAMVRCEVDEHVIHQAQVVEHIQDMPFRGRGGHGYTCDIIT